MKVSGGENQHRSRIDCFYREFFPAYLVCIEGQKIQDRRSVLLLEILRCREEGIMTIPVPVFFPYSNVLNNAQGSRYRKIDTSFSGIDKVAGLIAEVPLVGGDRIVIAYAEK